MNLIIIQSMKKLLTLSLTLVVLAIFAEISVAQSCIQPPSGLVAWWTLDSLNSDTNEYVDLAGGDNNGTPINNPQPILGRYVGNSLQINTGRYVEVPAANSTNLNFGMTESFSIDAWVKFTPGTQTEPIIHKLGSGGGYFLSIVTANPQSSQFKLQFQIDGAPPYDGPIITASPGTWIFVAAVITRSSTINTVKLYVGVPGNTLQGLPPSNIVSPSNASSNNPLWIGRSTPNPQAFLGIDEVEIFNRALSFTEINSIFIADINGKCKGNICTPTTTVTEGDLFPGGIVSFGVTSGPGSVTVDHVNAGTGLQSLIVVGVPVNAVVNIPAFTPGTTASVVVTFTPINPGLAVDFTLRAASGFHAAFIRPRCAVVCTPTTTVTEGNLFPGGIVSFGVSSGLGTVTVDHVNAGTGLQSLTVVGTPVNAVVSIPAYMTGTTAPVVVTFTPIDPNLPVDFTLRAASTFHAANIRVRCGTPPTGKPEH